MLFATFCATTPSLSAQIQIEDVIADTACNCLKKINTDSSASKVNAMRNACLNEAQAKNQAAIIESYQSGEQGKKMDESNPDNGRLMVKVYTVLMSKCPEYERVTRKIKSEHQRR